MPGCVVGQPVNIIVETRVFGSKINNISLFPYTGLVTVQFGAISVLFWAISVSDYGRPVWVNGSLVLQLAHQSGSWIFNFCT